ncbi:unnamed protein product [Boreogadus saida]
MAAYGLVSFLRVRPEWPGRTVLERAFPDAEVRKLHIGSGVAELELDPCAQHVKSSITSKHAEVSVLVVMRSVVWVNTLQVQVRVPARTANKKLSVLVVMGSVVWVNTLQVQVRVPACTANKKLSWDTCPSALTFPVSTSYLVSNPCPLPFALRDSCPEVHVRSTGYLRLATHDCDSNTCVFARPQIVPPGRGRGRLRERAVTYQHGCHVALVTSSHSLANQWPAVCRRHLLASAQAI